LSYTNRPEICDIALQQMLGDAVMDNEQLLGRYAQLRKELDDAYSASSWPVDQIDRIALELVETERELGSRGAGQNRFTDFG
jgi:hypothetical protein